MRNSLISVLLFMMAGCVAQPAHDTTRPTATAAVLSLVPGDPIYAEAAVNADGSITLTKVEKVSRPDITLTFSFSKTDNGMMLSVKNPLDKIVKYHLDMINAKGDAYNTSSCPVQAGLSVFESWPHPIPEIRVSNVHRAAKSEENLCIY